MTEAQEKLVRALFEAGMIRFGAFTLKDGSVAPFYIDLRPLVSEPEVLRVVLVAVKETLAPLDFDLICPVFYTAAPLLALVPDGYPAVYVRKETEPGRTKQKVEGKYEKGDVVVILDDVITSGVSKEETWEPLEEAGIVVRDVLVIVDRDQGGAARIGGMGKSVHAVLHMRDVLDFLVEAGLITAEMRAESIAYIDTHRWDT